nr:MAG TPA: zinc-ribbon domain protein [Caudoviricetes sp.]
MKAVSLTVDATGIASSIFIFERRNKKMIKLIKHGNHRTCSCYNCGCIFTFEKEDVTTEDLGKNEYVTRVQCPDCRKMNTVNLTGGWNAETV